MTTTELIRKCQESVGAKVDGIAGIETWAKIYAKLSGEDSKDTVHHGKLSSFADPADINAFRYCKAQGNSDEFCFRLGDNGIGCWNDDTSEGSGPSCAIPPDDMIEIWGSVENAKNKLIKVTANGTSAIAVLKDRMPWKKNIKNGAILDMNPDLCKLLGLTPPVMIEGSWRPL